MASWAVHSGPYPLSTNIRTVYRLQDSILDRKGDRNRKNAVVKLWGEKGAMVKVTHVDSYKAEISKSIHIVK